MDIPDQKSPVGIDDTDPSFVNWISDVVENRRVRVESLNGDFLKLESFSSLFTVRTCLITIMESWVETHKVLLHELNQLGDRYVIAQCFECGKCFISRSVGRLHLVSETPSERPEDVRTSG